jgi:putative copper export protein/methionine-rich copper-binding protein CopC
MRLSVALVVVAILAAATAAFAAPVITPADGAHLAAHPSAVRVVLPTPLEPALARAEVAGPAGVALATVRVAPEDPQAMLITIPADGDGGYRVAWWGQTTDGHPVAGATAFTAGQDGSAAAPVAPAGSEGTGPLAIAARFLVLLGVLGTAGLAVCRWLVLSPPWRAGGIAPPGDGDPDAVRAAAAAAAPAALARWWRAWWFLLGAWMVGLAVALPVQAAAVGGQWGALLGDSRWGTAWIALVALGVAAAVAGVAARRGDVVPAAPVPRALALGLPGIAGAAVLSWSGHAASGPDAGLGIALDAVHGWATAIWLGGLVMMLALASPVLAALGPVDRVRMGAGIVVRFSAVAITAVVLIVVTGVYRALAEVPSLSDLWTTAYGVTLLAKLAVFALMLALAAWNRMVLHPRLERAALGSTSPGARNGLAALAASIRAEIALGAVVMALVAVLVGLMPPG